MMDKIKALPTHMDFDGQRRAERIFQTIIILFAVVGLIWGYICQQFSQTVYILGAGFLLSCLLTLPPWPMYRLKPLSWQKPRDENPSSQIQKNKKKTK
ncbi:signal peptidase complex subunit 1 [Centruroides vittatus]|uniref:signal peptidase complex subunit 1 n=1 Tax=Centruroides vittatus TaxID=120091 RepID=UPI003510390D